MRKQILALAVLLALGGAVAAWVLLGDDTGAAVANDVADDNAPARVNTPIDRREFTPDAGNDQGEANPSATETRAPITEYRVAKDEDIPAPPKVVNDPNQGAYWLRLIDDATGQPLANTEVELYWMSSYGSLFHQGGAYDSITPEPPPVTTTSVNGCVRFVCDVGNKRTYTKGLMKPDTKLSMTEKSNVGFCMPRGQMVVTSTSLLYKAIFALVESGSQMPLDVRVRPPVTLRGTVKDAQGEPVPNAMVFLEALDVDARYYEWFQDQYPADERATWDRASMEHSDSFNVVWHSNTVFQDGKPMLFAIDRYTASSFGVYLVWRTPGGEEATRLASNRLVATSNARGEYIIPDVIHGKYRVLCCAGQRGALRKDMTINVDEECNFVTPAATGGSMRIRVTWTPTKEELKEFGEYCQPNFWIDQLERASPWRSDAAWQLADNVDYISVSKFVPNETTEILIHGLAPGEWSGTAVGVYNEAEPKQRFTATITKGETTTLDFAFGGKQMGTWAPSFRWQGEPIDVHSGFVLTNEQGLELTAHYSAESMNLPLGTYTVTLLDGWTHQFTIKKGETTTDVLEIPSGTLRVSMSERLMRILSANSEELYVYVDVPDITGMLDDALEAVNLEEHKFDENCVWSMAVPIGEFRIGLSGGIEVVLPVTVREGQETSVELTLDDLPSRYYAIVECRGFSEDEAPNWATGGTGFGSGASVTFGFRENEDEGDLYAVETSHTRGSENLQSIQVVEVETAGLIELFVFARTPNFVLQLSVPNGERDLELNLRHKQHRVIVPRDFETLAEADGAPTIMLKAEIDDERNYQCMLGLKGASATRSMSVHGMSSAREINAEAGIYELFVVAYEEDKPPVFARTNVSARRGVTETVVMSSLSFKALGRVDCKLILAGKGLQRYMSQGCTIQAVGEFFAGREIHIGDVYPPENGMRHYAKVEFPVTLIPGRYRLVPWKGAGKEDCREFTVTSGDVIKITLDATKGK